MPTAPGSLDRSSARAARFVMGGDIKVDTKGAGRAIEKLLEVVASGVGVLWEPRRMRAAAQADVDVKLIHARGEQQLRMLRATFDSPQTAVIDGEALDVRVGPDGEAIPLVRRVERRLQLQEAKRQINIEAVVAEAAGEIRGAPDAPVSSDPVDEDWTARFFQYAQDVSNESMRSLWAKVLANEVRRPCGTLRALEVLRNLSPAEAAIFGEVSGAVYNAAWILRRKEQPYGSYVVLKDAGLVTPADLLWKDEGVAGQAITYQYRDLVVRAVPAETKKVATEVYKLTPAGEALCRVVASATDLTAVAAHLRHLRNRGLTATAHRVTGRDEEFVKYERESFEPDE